MLSSSRRHLSVIFSAASVPPLLPGTGSVRTVRIWDRIRKAMYLSWIVSSWPASEALSVDLVRKSGNGIFRRCRCEYKSAASRLDVPQLPKVPKHKRTGLYLKFTNQATLGTPKILLDFSLTVGIILKQCVISRK